MRAVDLYSGVGGWSLGLRMAGVDVVASYEWWADANRTNALNNLHQTHEVDVRSLDPASVPKVDFVVGSPPCTHFSLANRGGKGNVLEGLKDVERFLEVVEAVRPRSWAMENVPRLADILRSELNQGGVLHRFAHLNPTVAVLDASEWGVPQRRKRAIIGSFDLDLLLSYRASARQRTLGDVVSMLSADDPVDPVWGLPIPPGGLTEHVREEGLSREEERMNRDAKTFHPVYNGMRFPDDPLKPSRTVTATCTRVSRESIVVEEGGAYRRPTLREKACLQSFPASYQFYAATHALKQKMVGNAVPPLLTYYIAHSMLGTPAGEVPSPPAAASTFSPPAEMPPPTRPDRPGRSYPTDRKFRAAIPGLRFKSGMRFELSNSSGPRGAVWRVRFFFGNSKRVSEVELGTRLIRDIKGMEGHGSSVAQALNCVVESGAIARLAGSEGLQESWSHRKDSLVHPHDLVDSLGAAAGLLLEREPLAGAEGVVSVILQSMGDPPGSDKVLRNARAVFAGMLVGSLVNEVL